MLPSPIRTNGCGLPQGTLLRGLRRVFGMDAVPFGEGLPDGILPPLQQLRFSTSDGGAEETLRSGLRAGEGGVVFFFLLSGAALGTSRDFVADAAIRSAFGAKRTLTSCGLREHEYSGCAPLQSWHHCAAHSFEVPARTRGYYDGCTVKRALVSRFRRSHHCAAALVEKSKPEIGTFQFQRRVRFPGAPHPNANFSIGLSRSRPR